MGEGVQRPNIITLNLKKHLLVGWKSLIPAMTVEIFVPEYADPTPLKWMVQL